MRNDSKPRPRPNRHRPTLHSRDAPGGARHERPSSGFVASDSRQAPLGTILSYGLSGRFVLLTSPDIQRELTNTLSKPYFLGHRRRPQIVRMAERFLASAVIVVPDRIITGVASHSEDDRILSLAVSADADYLVTGDAQLLALGIINQIPILTSSAFSHILTTPIPTP